jgi:hypothetical protein
METQWINPNHIMKRLLRMPLPRGWLCFPMLAVTTAALQASPHHSADYSIATEITDGGGVRATSADYTHDGSVGGVVGVSTVAAPAEITKHGYIGQLFEMTSLVVDASPASVEESATRQLAARELLNDGTYLGVSPSAVAWSVVNGPLAGISPAGLVTAGTVFQDTSATVQGAYDGFGGTLILTVINSLPDNNGSYAGDGLDDAWQVQYFGPDNPEAAPLKDPDGDDQSNQFEFATGINPTDPVSRFRISTAPVAGQPGQMNVVFSPRWPDRTYTVLTSSTMESDGWSLLTGAIVSDNGNERTVTDPNASQSMKFYRVQVVKP